MIDKFLNIFADWNFMKPTSLILLTALPILSAEDIKINSTFAGGNVVLAKVDKKTVYLTPDLREGQPWFYWCFDAEVSKPGRYIFNLGKPQKIGVQGPAISFDDGKTWQWLGNTQVELTSESESFSYEFSSKNQRVRFSVAIPYLQENLDNFLRSHAENKLLHKGELAKTRTGKTVELLRIGNPGTGLEAMLVTARHHACESMASYVLEGFLEEALSNSPTAVEFRKKYVLFAVPLVDKDGVQNGDQGKNRKPHDHNRDYGENPIFPEIRAIQELAHLQKIHYSVDFHCPALRGDIHEAFHFLGYGLPHIKQNLNEWIQWIREERPQEVMVPLNLLVDPSKPNSLDRRINSHFMATLQSCLLAATLEVPYTQTKPLLDPNMARAYGAGLLRAWSRAVFQSPNSNPAPIRVPAAEFTAFRKQFLDSYKSKPKEMENLVNSHLGEKTPRIIRVEATNLLAGLRLYQSKYAEARDFAQSVLNDGDGTLQQTSTARLLILEALCKDPKTTPRQVKDFFQQAMAIAYTSHDYRAKIHDLAAAFYRQRNMYPEAVTITKNQLPFVPLHEKGRLWNRLAHDYDSMQMPADALEARKKVLMTLKTAVEKPEISIFGAMMALDYFEALYGIPGTSQGELESAGKIVLNHKIATSAMKDRVLKLLGERNQK
jgi:hypothetical protein